MVNKPKMSNKVALGWNKYSDLPPDKVTNEDVIDLARYAASGGKLSRADRRLLKRRLKKSLR